MRVLGLLPFVLLAGCAVLASADVSARRAGIRVGFVEQLVADSLDSPVSMAIAPDGRVFVCEQGGRLRVVRHDALLARSFVNVPTVANQEEGLLGVAFDPGFERNQFVYVCYTAAAPTRHQVVARYTASGDTALAGSARILLDLDDNLDHQHVGGALRFGADGSLFIATGENGEGSLSQSLRSTHGKLLRIHADGSIPTDNPFYTLADGNRRAIWARGLRNAFSFDVQRGTGRIFVNDVGGGKFEEVDDVIAGENYGWPIFEGPGRHEKFRFPIHSYDHAHGCAITGGAFYNPPRPAFPAAWVGRYFYAEYCRNEIRWIDPLAPAKYSVFGTTRAAGPVDLRVGPDGNLYYLARGNSNPTGGDHTSSGMVVRVSRARTAR